MPPSNNQDVSHALDAKREMLAQRIVARHYELEPTSWQLYGSVGRDKCVQDAEYHLMYLGEAIGAASPSVFLDYVAWLKVLFAGLGFPENAVEVPLDCTRRSVQDGGLGYLLSRGQNHHAVYPGRAQGAPARPAHGIGDDDVSR